MALSRRIGRSRFTLVLLVLTSLDPADPRLPRVRPDRPRPQRRARRCWPRSAMAPRTSFRPVGNLWDGAFRLRRPQEAQPGRCRSRSTQMKSKIAAGQVAEQSNQQLLEQANLPFVGDLTTVRAPVCRARSPTSTTPSRSARARAAASASRCRWWSAPDWWASSCRWRATRSVVQLITDTSFSVGVTVLGTDVGGSPGVEGVATGQGNGRPHRRPPSTPGDTVKRRRHPRSRGASRAAPTRPACRSATVASVSSDVDNLQQTLSVDLLADVHNLSYVSVVLWPSTPS